jgi:hypothetical protein
MALKFEIKNINKENPIIEEIISKSEEFKESLDGKINDSWGVIFSYDLDENMIYGYFYNKFEFSHVCSAINDINDCPEKFVNNPMKGPKKRKRI